MVEKPAPMPLNATDFGAAAAAILTSVTGLMFPARGVANSFLVDLANDLEKMVRELPDSPAKQAVQETVGFLRVSERRPFDA